MNKDTAFLMFIEFVLAVFFLLLFSSEVLALSSASYKVKQYQLPSFSEQLSSVNYSLDATGSPLVGVSSSATYGLDVGFPSVTGGTISLSLDSDTVNLGSLNPGTPITGQSTVTVVTDSSSGYSLAIEKNKLLTSSNGSATIDDFSATIASPLPWSGSGFGFSVLSATTLESKWGSGSNFAAIPLQSATTFHTTSQPISSSDQTVIKYKLDSSSDQQAGSYSCIVAILASALP